MNKEELHNVLSSKYEDHETKKGEINRHVV